MLFLILVNNDESKFISTEEFKFSYSKPLKSISLQIENTIYYLDEFNEFLDKRWSQILSKITLSDNDEKHKNTIIKLKCNDFSNMDDFYETLPNLFKREIELFNYIVKNIKLNIEPEKNHLKIIFYKTIESLLSTEIQVLLRHDFANHVKIERPLTKFEKQHQTLKFDDLINNLDNDLNIFKTKYLIEYKSNEVLNNKIYLLLSIGKINGEEYITCPEGELELKKDFAYINQILIEDIKTIKLLEE